MTVSAVVAGARQALTAAGVRVAVGDGTRPQVPYCVASLAGQAGGDVGRALAGDRSAACTLEIVSVGRTAADACWVDEKVFGVLAGGGFNPPGVTVLGVSCVSSPTLMIGEGRLMSAARRYRISYTLS